MERLEEERVNHHEEVEEAKVRMEAFDEEIMARLGVGGEEGDEETASVVKNHHLNCHLALALHHRCHLEDWQHIDFEGGEAAQGGRWEGGGEEVNKTFSLSPNITSFHTVAILIKIFCPTSEFIIMIISYHDRLPAHATVSHLLDWAVVLVHINSQLIRR